MTTQITTDNIQTSSVYSLQGPRITNIQVTNSSYVVLDDTAVSTSGGYIKITGTGFATGSQVLVNNIAATSTTYVSTTELRAQLPATAAGTYILYVSDTTGGLASKVNGITFSGTPTWVTGSTLTSGTSAIAYSLQLSATSDSTITYALQAGSTLPTGLSLSSSGLLSGTVTVGADTTYSFTITATDVELQDSPRTFSLTIVAATVPGAPTIGSATATGSTTATVSFTAPVSNGGSTITRYTAVSSPGSITGTLSQAGSGTITVSGLSPNTSYTFTVYATNAVGNSASSAASNSITTAQVAPSSVEYLVVAGGGGGMKGKSSTYWGSGGGAGGVTTASGYSVSASTSYTITVGAGGADQINLDVNGNNGNPSVFATITSSGGGGGLYNTGYGGTSGNGFIGGAPGGFPTAGGGGGASVAGSAQNGGNGTSSSIIGTSTYYGGGGGAGRGDGSTVGTGGLGGGGQGSNTQVYSDAACQGAVNTGGGGGGGGGSNNKGSAGGSGVVIIAYPSTNTALASIGGGLTYSVSTSSRSGYRVYTFTAGTGTISW